MLSLLYRKSRRLTVSGESQLSAGHTSINIIPEVITHSAPLVVPANFDSSLGRIGSKPCQSDTARLTASCVTLEASNQDNNK